MLSTVFKSLGDAIKNLFMRHKVFLFTKPSISLDVCVYVLPCKNVVDNSKCLQSGI